MVYLQILEGDNVFTSTLTKTITFTPVTPPFFEVLNIKLCFVRILGGLTPFSVVKCFLISIILSKLNLWLTMLFHLLVSSFSSNDINFLSQNMVTYSAD